MNDPMIHYAVLRDGRDWNDVSTTLLDRAPDGALTLARVPGAAGGQEIENAGPYEAHASGLAVGARGDLYVADTARQRVIWIGGICDSRIILPGVGGVSAAPGHFSRPRGVLVGPPGGLYVADSGNARVQVFSLPSLEVRAIWKGPFQIPTGLATDSHHRVYVLDRGLKRVLRFNAWGRADDPYNAAMAVQHDLKSPAFMTIAADDTLYVTDDVADVVWRFDPDGQLLEPLPSTTADSPSRPRVLAAHGNQLYVADAASGHVWVFSRSANRFLGTVLGYRGPVTALAVDKAGALYIKPGMDEIIHSLKGDSAFVSSGQLTAGPLDAGERSEWERVAVQAELPERCGVRLQTFTTDDPAAVPTSPDWIEALALDTLLPPLTLPSNGQPHRGRYLWLRVLLTSDDRRTSPRLIQIHAETPGESYMKFLPAIYSREDAERGFLERWLEMFRSELGDLELELEEMPRRFEPALAPEDHLGWLASWLAFDPPAGLTTEEMRSLLLRIHQLYDRRGTPFGVSEFAHLYSGGRPLIIEGFRERHIWQLGHTSALGCDTALAPALPNGLIVPDKGDLSGDYKQNCDGTGSLVVGDIVVGECGPLAETDLGEPLFSDTAFRFTVLIPAGQIRKPDMRQALSDTIESEKPAHTDFHLCFVEADMRVGFQSRIGIDSIVADPPEPLALSGSWLGLDSFLGADAGDDGAGRVGANARLGRDTFLR